MRATLAGLGLSTLLFAACMPVPFDLAISQGAATASRMTKENPSLISLQDYDQSGSGFAFYPQVLGSAFDYAVGFVVWSKNLELQIKAVRQGSSSGYEGYAQQSFSIPNPDAHAPSYLVRSVQSGTSYLLLMTFDALDPFDNNSYYRLFGDGTSMLSVLNGSTTMKSLVGLDPGIFDLAVMGASVYPSAGSDEIQWLGAQTPSSGNFLELGYSISSGGVGPSMGPRGLGWYTLPFMPTPAVRCTYFYDENFGGDPARFPNRSFASWWNGGSWTAYAWDSPGVYKALPIDHRIDALLSTGQLLSTEDGTGRLYDREGNLLATFPLGNLVFIGELDTAGIPRCYFSQCLIYDQTLHFNVYGIDTDQLETLGR